MTSALEGFVADQLADLGMQTNVDGRISHDPIGEVPGHRLAEVVLADDQAQPRDVLGQEQRGLTGRVATPNGDHRMVAAQLRLDCVAA